jgi:hypothetical protein
LTSRAPEMIDGSAAQPPPPPVVKHWLNVSTPEMGSRRKAVMPPLNPAT